MHILCIQYTTVQTSPLALVLYGLHRQKINVFWSKILGQDMARSQDKAWLDALVVHLLLPAQQQKVLYLACFTQETCK